MSERDELVTGIEASAVAHLGSLKTIGEVLFGELCLFVSSSIVFMARSALFIVLSIKRLFEWFESVCSQHQLVYLRTVQV